MSNLTKEQIEHSINKDFEVYLKAIETAYKPIKAMFDKEIKEGKARIRKSKKIIKRLNYSIAICFIIFIALVILGIM